VTGELCGGAGWTAPASYVDPSECIAELPSRRGPQPSLPAARSENVSTLRRNLGWLLISQAATWAITAVTVILVPRYLGDAELGTFAFAVSFVGFFALLGGLGTSPLIAKAVARDHSILGRYVYNAVLFKLLLTVGLTVVGLITAVAIGTKGAALTLVAIGFIGMGFVMITEVLQSALAGLERMARPAMWGVTQVYVSNALGVVVLALGGGAIAYGAIMTFGSLIPAVALTFMIWPLVRGHQRFDPSVWRWLVRGGLPLVALEFSNRVYGTVDIPILTVLSGERTVGWYTLAQRWIGIPAFISTAVVTAFFPSFSALAKSSPVRLAAQVNKAVTLVLLAAVPAAFGLGVVAEDLIQSLYPAEFGNSIVLMQILAFGIPLTALDTILAVALIAADRQNPYIVVAAAAAVVNPVVCLILIPITDRAYGNGAIGAAIATVGTEVLIMCAALWFRAPGVLDRRTVGLTARILAAGLLMGSVVWAAGAQPLALQVLIGIAVYAAASIAFRTVSVADLRAVLPQRFAAPDAAGPGGEPGSTAVEERADHSGEVDGPHPSGDLYAQSGGQDRDGGPPRSGE
jgi:O-antigen/teichoic acid export membrane protein